MAHCDKPPSLAYVRACRVALCRRHTLKKLVPETGMKNLTQVHHCFCTKTTLGQSRCMVSVTCPTVSVLGCSCAQLHARSLYHKTRKPSCRWQTRAAWKHVKNCSNSSRGHRHFRTVYCNCSPLAEERLAISTKSIHRWKVHLVGYNSVAESTGVSPFV